MDSNFIVLLDHLVRKVQDPIRLTIACPNLVAHEPDRFIALIIDQVRERHPDFSNALLAKDAVTSYVEFYKEIIKLVNQGQVLRVELHGVVPFRIAVPFSINRRLLALLQMFLLFFFLRFVVEDGDSSVDGQPVEEIEGTEILAGDYLQFYGAAVFQVPDFLSCGHSEKTWERHREAGVGLFWSYTL